MGQWLTCDKSVFTRNVLQKAKVNKMKERHLLERRVLRDAERAAKAVNSMLPWYSGVNDEMVISGSASVPTGASDDSSGVSLNDDGEADT